MGSEKLLIEAVDGLGLSASQIRYWSMQTMLDGNPSDYYNAFAGDKIKYVAGNVVIITQYYKYPDIVCIVNDIINDRNMLELLIVETGEIIFHLKDGVMLLGNSIEEVPDHQWSIVKSIEESIAYYIPKRIERKETIELCIQIMKIMNS